jgi:hypothetical protein
MKALCIGLCVILQAIILVRPAASNDWEQVFESDSLRLFKRDYAGSSLDEIRGVVLVKASLNSVMALLKDAPFNQHWVYRSGGAQVLQEHGYAQAFVYGVVDAPPPMKDRDTVVRFDYQQNPVTADIVVSITNAPDFVATRKEFVRVPAMGGYWGLKPQEDGWVEVTYQVYGDPGGWIPTWLANQAALISVKNTLQNLVAVVDRYANATSDFVKERGPMVDQ